MVLLVDFDFIFLPLFMRRVLRSVSIVPRPERMVPLLMVPSVVVVVPVPGVWFMVPDVEVLLGEVVPLLGVVVPGVVWAKAALAQRAKAAAKKREVAFMSEKVGGREKAE